MLEDYIYFNMIACFSIGYFIGFFLGGTLVLNIRSQKNK